MNKKIIAFLLTIVTILSAVSIMGSAAKLMAGDVSGDGKVTASDARKVLRVAAGLDVMDAEKMIVADITGDGKITASDARKILRAAAGLETLPEIETTTEAETTTEPESTTEVETTTEPETTTEAEITTEGVVVTELPEPIQAFFDGEFYLECDMSGDESESSIKLARKGKKMEASMTMDGFEMSIFADGDKVYLKFPYGGKTYYLNMKDLADNMGVELDIDVEELVGQLTFGTLEDYNAPVLTTEEYKDDEYETYTFVDDEGYALAFYLTSRGKVAYIVSRDKDGQIASEIEVTELTKKIPSKFLTIKNCKEGNITTLMLAMSAFGGSGK